MHGRVDSNASILFLFRIIINSKIVTKKLGITIKNPYLYSVGNERYKSKSFGVKVSKLITKKIEKSLVVSIIILIFTMSAKR